MTEESRKLDTFSACMICEGVEDATEEETLEAWQFLINSGVVWTLQGFYGRTAAGLIERGLCSPAQPGGQK